MVRAAGRSGDGGNRIAHHSGPSLSICLKGELDRAFFVRTARRVARLLARTPVRLVLDVEHLQLQQLNLLLAMPHETSSVQ